MFPMWEAISIDCMRDGHHTLSFSTLASDRPYVTYKSTIVVQGRSRARTLIFSKFFRGV